MYTIYAYKKKSDQQVVYVGQTVNLQQRRKQHEKDEVWNNNRAEYNYPLSRAIRKYGADFFEVIILEEVQTLKEANLREDYWITFYNTIENGYNQTRGGNNRVKITDGQIEEIRVLLKNSDIPYSKIALDFGCSEGFISGINRGNSYTSSQYDYPIRKTKIGLHFSEEEVANIILLLQDKTITLKEIASRYNVNQNVIVRINQGQSYYNANLIYPIRQGRAARKRKEK